MRTKTALSAAGISFATIDLTDNLGLLDDIKRQSGLATVPQARALSLCRPVPAASTECI